MLSILISYWIGLLTLIIGLETRRVMLDGGRQQLDGSSIQLTVHTDLRYVFLDRDCLVTNIFGPRVGITRDGRESGQKDDEALEQEHPV